MKPFNLMLVGVGGQGVFTLTRVIQHLCEMSGYRCQSCVLKGGAQRHGTVQAMLRIFFTANADFACYGSRIPKGGLDLLLGFEPWEALRCHPYFGGHTHLIVNHQIGPLFLFGQRSDDRQDPVVTLTSFGLKMVCKPYTDLAMATFQDRRMANYLMGYDAILEGFLPFDIDVFKDLFGQQVPVQKHLDLLEKERV